MLFIWWLESSFSVIPQQCSDAIKRAQILKEKMGLPKTISTPAAQVLPAQHTALHAAGSPSSQGSHAAPDSLERQSSFPIQQPPSASAIGKAISMPTGSSSMLRAYAAGAVQTGVDEEQPQAPSSPQRNILGRCQHDL